MRHGLVLIVSLLVVAFSPFRSWADGPTCVVRVGGDPPGDIKGFYDTPGGLLLDAEKGLFRLLRQCYELGVVCEPPAFRRHRDHLEPMLMPLEIANIVLGDPDRFPGFLVTAAEERCRNDVSSKVTAVAAIAEKEQWFVL